LTLRFDGAGEADRAGADHHEIVHVCFCTTATGTRSSGQRRRQARLNSPLSTDLLWLGRDDQSFTPTFRTPTD
jgi:hypothetical protein